MPFGNALSTTPFRPSAAMGRTRLAPGWCPLAAMPCIPGYTLSGVTSPARHAAGPLRCRRWGHAPLRGLLKGIGQLEEARLAASHAGEADAIRGRLGVERLREWRCWAVRDHPE